MTTAATETIVTIETTAPKARKPRAPRKPKTAIVQPAETSETITPPTCQTCGAILGWRDSAYAKGTDMCKVCHQKSERKRLRGVYVPRERLPQPSQAFGTERTARLTARPGLPRAPKPASVPPMSKATRTRASRRAQARSTATTTQQQESAA